MQDNGAAQHRGDHRSTIPALAGVALVSLVVSALLTTAALIVADRFDRPTVIVADPALPTIAALIDGAVATPGVYPLPAGARLDDLIRRAGGLSSDADVSDLNIAARIGDGERIEIPSVSRATPVPPPTESTSADEPLRVNINTATIEELDQLPGIGPVLGERIIAYRDTNGPFTSIDELAAIDGISSRLVQELRPYLALDD